MSKKSQITELKLLTVEEAAQITCYGNELIKQEVEAGKLKIFRPFTRFEGNYKIPAIEIDRWIESLTHTKAN